MKELSPSMLPKLASCPTFVGAGGSSEAAQRGTAIDLAIRERIHPTGQSVYITDEDKPVVDWGFHKLRELGCGIPIETREEYLAMHLNSLSKIGTADALCKPRRWVADIKTGQVRNYREQMAAYSAACMEMFFEERWTAHVVYVDQQLVRSYEFTYEEADRIVKKTIDGATFSLAQPRPCEYCSWCANKNTCSALVTQSKEALANVAATNGSSLEIIRNQLMCDPQTMGQFAQRWKFAEKEIAKPVLDRLKEEIENGADVENWKLCSRKSTGYVEFADIVNLNITKEQIVAAIGGKMSEKQFRELCAMTGEEVPEAAIKVGAPTQFIRQTK